MRNIYKFVALQYIALRPTVFGQCTAKTRDKELTHFFEKSHYSKSHIDKIFKQKTDPAITEWYTVNDIYSKFNMSLNAIYSFAYDHNIPKKKEGGKVYYSKVHFEHEKGIAPAQTVFYTTEEAIERYGITRDALYHYIKAYNIPKEKVGRSIRISKLHLDKLFQQPII